MKHTIRHCAFILILLYLSVPVAGFANVDVSMTAAAELQLYGGIAADAPCEQCPCDDGHGSDCCGANVCGCAFHSPPEQIPHIRYAPLVVPIRPTDSFWVFPQVYLPIFVPPQNVTSLDVVCYRGLLWPPMAV